MAALAAQAYQDMASEHSNWNYACRVIMQWLKSEGFAGISIVPTRLALGHYWTAMYLTITPQWQLSIQTHSEIVGSAFAETAVLVWDRLITAESLGYTHNQAIRHDGPDELFAHLRQVLGVASAEQNERNIA